MRINIYYITILILGSILLRFFCLNQSASPLSFYGFAESNETKINYNYPVVVDKIVVSPGQEVLKGDTLMFLERRKPKETLDDYDYKIDKLKYQAEYWKSKKENTIALLQEQQESELEGLKQRIELLQKELNFKSSLSYNLQSVEIDTSSSGYNPIKHKLDKLKEEYEQRRHFFTLKIRVEKSEMHIGINPFKQEILQLEKEKQFSQEQKVVIIALVAPVDGLIGSISCKKEEHIPSFSTLLTIYEPHSRFIRGYIHENLTLQVEKGDGFVVSSLNTAEQEYPGKVIGLGSRIVEIPSRLRKNPEIKSYGREVIVEIEKNNSFLQKEKVSLFAMSSNNSK